MTQFQIADVSAIRLKQYEAPPPPPRRATAEAEGAIVLSGRGGDYELYLGQDLSIGYLSHDAVSVELYFQESFTFVVQAAEAAVPIAAR